METIILSVIQRTIIAGTPLLLATIGEIITERAGILNLGVEGMMAMGAVTGFMVTFLTANPLLGMLVSILVCAAFSMIHGFVSISLQSNQVVSGLALTMLGLGISEFLGKPFIGKPLAVKMENFKIPLLGDIPFVGEAFFNHSPYLYLALILGGIAWFFLYHSQWGIVIRSVGENPKAAESRGINVSFVRYACVAVGGALAGLAGSHLSISYSKSWIEGMTAGRGWIVIALTTFSLWNPLRAFGGAFLFGGIFVLQYLLQPLGISPSILSMLPYIATLGVLCFYGINETGRRKMRAPSALGEAFRRGER